MNILQRPKQKHKWLCPICGTNKNLPATQIDVYDGSDFGTGRTYTVQVHIDCINLTATKLCGELIFIQVVQKIEKGTDKAPNAEIL